MRGPEERHVGSLQRKEGNGFSPRVPRENEARPNHFCFKLLGFVVIIQSLSPIQLFATPWTVALQTPLSMGFPRLENCHLLLQGIFLTRYRTHISCIGGRFFTTEPPGKPLQAASFVIMFYSSSRKLIREAAKKCSR